MLRNTGNPGVQLKAFTVGGPSQPAVSSVARLASSASLSDGDGKTRLMQIRLTSRDLQFVSHGPARQKTLPPSDLCDSGRESGKGGTCRIPLGT